MKASSARSCRLASYGDSGLAQYHRHRMPCKRQHMQPRGQQRRYNRVPQHPQWPATVQDLMQMRHQRLRRSSCGSCRRLPGAQQSRRYGWTTASAPRCR
jgi:hypothetical protein